MLTHPLLVRAGTGFLLEKIGLGGTNKAFRLIKEHQLALFCNAKTDNQNIYTEINKIYVLYNNVVCSIHYTSMYSMVCCASYLIPADHIQIHVSFNCYCSSLGYV